MTDGPAGADGEPVPGGRSRPHTDPARALIVALLGTVALSAAILVVRESPERVAGAIGWIAVVTAPLVVSGWAVLDAARRPRWAWAFAGRPQVAWMTAIMLTALVPGVGVAVAVLYLVRVRPRLAAIEAGRF